MGMVTEMRLPGGGGDPGTRFNYRGMHRYIITLLAHPSCNSLVLKETVIPTLDVLRDACHAHLFEVYAYCFLPDRLVLLVRGKEESSDMKLFLTAFRKASESAFGLNGGKHLWSKKYQERVLRKTEVTRTIAEEIFRLPVKAGLAGGAERYAFQGSFVLAGVPPPRPGRGPHSRPGGGPPRRTKGRPPFRRPGGNFRKTGRT
jgi:putative transposase